MIGVPILIGLAVLVGFLIYKLVRPKNSEFLRQIPGPHTYPILGLFPTIIKKTPTDFSEWVWASLTKYGSPTRFEFGPSFNIILSQADQIETLLKSSTNIDKSREYDFIVDWLGKGLLISSGAKWFKRRKQLTPAFHFQILKDFIPVFNEQAAVLTSLLGKQIHNGNNPLNVCPYITNCTLDIICETAMGKQLGAQERSSEYATSLGRFAELATNRFRNFVIWPNLIFHNSPVGKESDRHLKILHDFTRQVIHERDALLSKKADEAQIIDSGSSEIDPFKSKRQRLAFLDMLLDLKAAGQMTEEEVREEVDTFMFEGHDTTATGLMWALYCIGAHPDVQEKMFEEISSLIGSDPNHHVTSDDLSKLKYLDCVLKESQRLFPSVPMIGRLTTEDFECGKYTIPSDTYVNMSIFGLHRNPEHFPDPLRFDPDRFLLENAEGRHPFAFVPFSAGPRNCIGQRFALQEEKVIITHMMRKFEFKATQRFEDMAPSMELVLRPVNGVWLRMTARD